MEIPPHSPSSSSSCLSLSLLVRLVARKFHLLSCWFWGLSCVRDYAQLLLGYWDPNGSLGAYEVSTLNQQAISLCLLL